MWRLHLARLVWIPLVVIPLQTAVACLPPDSSFPVAFTAAPGLVWSHAVSSNALCEVPSSISGELSLQSENQSRQRLMPIRCGALLLRGQQKAEGRPQLATVSFCSPIRQFFPRKLSPSTTADDPPFLS